MGSCPTVVATAKQIPFRPLGISTFYALRAFSGGVPKINSEISKPTHKYGAKKSGIPPRWILYQTVLRRLNTLLNLHVPELGRRKDCPPNAAAASTKKGILMLYKNVPYDLNAISN